MKLTRILSLNPSTINKSLTQTCIFCYVRGGPLKRLANPSNSATKRPYWAHLTCSLLAPHLNFLDTARRIAYLQHSSIDFAAGSDDAGNDTTSFVIHFPLSQNNGDGVEHSKQIEAKVDQSSYSSSIYDDDESSRCKRTSPPHKRHRPSTTFHHCVVCGLTGRGRLPLASCWDDKCTRHYHVTCAQLAGVYVGSDVFPNFVFLACDDHPFECHRRESHLEPVSVGDRVTIRHPGNPPKFVNGSALRLVSPVYCRLSFPDGTFSNDTPPRFLTDVDWENKGPPRIGSKVNVLWDDGHEYPASYQGSTEESWEIRLNTGRLLTLSRSDFAIRLSIARRPSLEGLRE